MLVKSPPALHTQVALADVFLQVLSRRRRDVSSLRGVVLLDIENDIKPDHVHQLEGAFVGFENASEDCINLRWRARSLSCGQKRLSLDGRPYPAPVS